MRERESYRELILENIEYDILAQNERLDRDRLDELVELMVDTVCSNREMIRVAGDDYPAEVVRSRFLKLNASHIEYVLDRMEDVPVTTFSLAECVSELCEPYRLIAETNGLRFQIEIIEDMSVRLPENQLKKALSNILSNAVNYTEAERHIKVKLEKSVLSIQNECVPLSPDELQHIFEPFYRPNRARDPANGGNGLGLYIVKTILDKQGLQYCFTSMKSKTGMEFVIYF